MTPKEPWELVNYYTRDQIRAVIEGDDGKGIDYILRFLHADPKFHGTGYQKVKIWKYIRAYTLPIYVVKELEAVAIHCLRRLPSREHTEMFKTMAAVGRPAFWNTVRMLFTDSNPVVRYGAYCLSAYADGVVAGGQRYSKLQKIQWRYGRDVCFEYVQDMVKIMVKGGTEISFEEYHEYRK